MVLDDAGYGPRRDFTFLRDNNKGPQNPSDCRAVKGALVGAEFAVRRGVFAVSEFKLVTDIGYQQAPGS